MHDGLRVLALCTLDHDNFRLAFKPEVAAWCRASLKPGWRLNGFPTILLAMHLTYQDHSIYGQFTRGGAGNTPAVVIRAPLVTFHDDSDLLAFYLRWL